MKTPFLSRLQEACDLVGAKLEVIPDGDNSGRITLPSGRVRYFHRLRWDLNTLGKEVRGGSDEHRVAVDGVEERW